MKKNKKKNFKGTKVNGVETIATIKVQNKIKYNSHQPGHGPHVDKTEYGPRNNKANQKAKNALKKHIG